MIVTQDYGWSQLARAAGRGWPAATGWAMEQAAQAGLGGWEPTLSGPADARRIGALARAHGLALPSVFVSGQLCGPAQDTLALLTETAASAAREGARLVTVYPDPPPGGAMPDAALAWQRDNLLALAQRLRDLGLALAYHPEEPDFARAGRAFHHMLAGTDPALIRLCLDADTVWRGAGGSMLAVLDVVRLYGGRIDALHLRQSRAGIWTQALGPGDIDYPALAAALGDRRPLLVIEQAAEDGTPATPDPVATHRASLDWVRATFGVA